MIKLPPTKENINKLFEGVECVPAFIGFDEAPHPVKANDNDSEITPADIEEAKRAASPQMQKFVGSPES